MVFSFEQRLGAVAGRARDALKGAQNEEAHADKGHQHHQQPREDNLRPSAKQKCQHHLICLLVFLTRARRRCC
jgi:hypothetical protein